MAAQTITALDGASAIKLAETLDGLDLLVTDVMMPHINGVELARVLRQRDPNLKVLYLTGYSDALFKEKESLWEGEAFLDKPFSPSSLMQAVSLIPFEHLDGTGPQNRRSNPSSN